MSAAEVMPMRSTGDFWTDCLIAAAAVWLFMAPLVAGSAVLEFFAWRRQRQIDRLYGRK